MKNHGGVISQASLGEDRGGLERLRKKLEGHGRRSFGRCHRSEVLWEGKLKEVQEGKLGNRRSFEGGFHRARGSDERDKRCEGGYPLKELNKSFFKGCLPKGKSVFKGRKGLEIEREEGSFGRTYNHLPQKKGLLNRGGGGGTGQAQGISQAQGRYFIKGWELK